ncbi:fibronectin/fibrinogen-binding protein [Oscillospiraceae bacterium HV4-5-C5C]|nr:fibronectin/fibrinogen-binding protein [Oscillospiraceae bacterium HV4-5-C5C]
MPLDGVSAYFLGLELNAALSGSRIDRIQQPSRFDIILQTRGPGRNSRLLLSANPSQPRLHQISHSPEVPLQAPGFCMLLRKYLQGARIEKIETLGFERVFVFYMGGLDEMGDRREPRLLLELMGRYSNLILLNREGTIIDSLIHVDNQVSSRREIMPARPYTPPPDQHKLSPAAALAALQDGRFWPAAQAVQQSQQPRQTEQLLLALLQGFSPQLCQAVLWRAGVDHRCLPGKLTLQQQDQIGQALTQVLLRIQHREASPSLYYADAARQKPRDFHALALEGQGFRQDCTSLSQAMEAFYEIKERQNELEQKRQALTRIVRKALDHSAKKLQIHLSGVRQSRDFMRNKELGDILLANLYRIEGGDQVLVAQDFYDPELKEISISLHPNRSPGWNAQAYYHRYQKGKNRFEADSRFLAEDQADCSYYESLLTELEQADTPGDLQGIRQEMMTAGLISPEQEQHKKAQRGGFYERKRQRSRGQAAGHSPQAGLPEGPRRYMSSDGWLIMAGRNNLQNDRLTLKTAHKQDLWFHVHQAPGTHVIVRSAGQEVPETTLLEAAQTAAWFSRASRGQQGTGGGGGKIVVDYCPVRQVRKPAGAKPGMVIYDHYQSLTVEPLDPARQLRPAATDDNPA